MTSLPPKPVSSPPPPPRKDDDERRGHRHLSQEDRFYVPSRPGRLADSYVASYDQARHTGRYRDRDWERRTRDTWDRTPRGREDDKDYYRRRDDTYIASDDRRTRRPPSPRRSDRPYRSRSPRGRRPYSPPRYAPRFPHSRSPPPKRPRYSSRSPPRSPRRRQHSRSPEKGKGERSANRLNESSPTQLALLSTSPEKRKRERSAHRWNEGSPTQLASLSTSTSHPKKTASTGESPRRNQGETKSDQSTNVTESKLSISQNVPDNKAPSKSSPLGRKPDEKPLLSNLQQQPQHASNHIKDEVRRSPAREHDPEFKARERTPSPPRQPRFMNNQSSRDGPHGRRSSRSPPRAPRTFPRSSLAQSTAGLHTGRRPPLAGASSTTDSKKVDKPERPNVTAGIDAEIARLESHRTSLATEYVQLARNARRALHELDLAMLDLRAAEARRKVTSSQLEKARVGMLGIDATVVDSPVM